MTTNTIKNLYGLYLNSRPKEEMKELPDVTVEDLLKITGVKIPVQSLDEMEENDVMERPEIFN